MATCTTCGHAGKGHSATGCVVWAGHIKDDVDGLNGYTCSVFCCFTYLHSMLTTCCCWLAGEGV